jgi:hypothetical protein
MNPLLSAMNLRFRHPGFADGRSRAAKRKARRRLSLEILEDRTVPTAVAAPSGLVSWWQAQNSAVDAMGLNNATLYNGATYAAGEVGQAFSFDGVNDRASVADSASLKLTASLTIEGWIKVSAFPTSGSGEIFFRGDDSSSPYSLSIETGGLLRFAEGGTDLKSPLSLGQLTHIAATLDDATGLMSLYVNGALAARTTTDLRPSGDLTGSNPGVGIGNTGGYPGTSTNSPFNGLIDELSVYNRALTPGEVQGIYKAGSDGKVFSPIAVDGPSVLEGAVATTTPMTFTITRTGSLSGTMTVSYMTADDTAIAGTDYVATSGSFTFADGQATQPVQVTVNGNNTDEPNKTFKLIVTPSGGTAVMGVATILNDDSAISISNASATEADTTLRYFDDFLPVQSQLGGGRFFTFGPDGNIYIAGRFTDDVQKYDGKTGAYLGEVIPSGTLGLHAPWGLSFGPDGNLYVVGGQSNNVLRYNMTTGAIDEFISRSGGITGGKGLTFDSAGNLFVSTSNSSTVLRFQGPNGASPGAPLPAPGQSGAIFVSQGSGGLNSAQGALGFGPDGNLYIGSFNTNAVLRYNGTTGAFIDTFVAAGAGGLTGPGYLAFRPDGYLYVSSQNDGAVYRYNATTGGFSSKVLQNSSTPYGSGALVWDAVGNLYANFNSPTASQTRISRYGPASQEAFTVSLDYASALPITVNDSTADGTARAGTNYSAVTSGSVVFAPGETSKTILIQTLDDAVVDPALTFTVSLSGESNATVSRRQGTATINDGDANKFFVVDDGGTDRTYRYGVFGNTLNNSALGSGDTAPRGAAANTTGTTIWVVDNNKNVYVYDPSGNSLGSWSAGGLGASATLTGIATNGTDVWLVDSNAAKVYKYAGAASRRSGSQSAVSSFSLVKGKGGNTNPQDIVTDGTSFWIVDGTALKVFKYTLSGSSLGSWTIEAANKNPTGITINPNNVSDIWIVDSGTKKVYQYIGAAGLTSGSQNAAASFALAANNTNPQGVADPPPSATQQVSPSAPLAIAVVTNPVPGAVVRSPSEAVRDLLFALIGNLRAEARLTFAAPEARFVDVAAQWPVVDLAGKSGSPIFARQPPREDGDALVWADWMEDEEVGANEPGAGAVDPGTDFMADDPGLLEF